MSSYPLDTLESAFICVCPHCQLIIQSKPIYVGKQVVCPHCDNNFFLPALPPTPTKPLTQLSKEEAKEKSKQYSLPAHQQHNHSLHKNNNTPSWEKTTTESSATDKNPLFLFLTFIFAFLGILFLIFSYIMLRPNNTKKTNTPPSLMYPLPEKNNTKTL